MSRVGGDLATGGRFIVNREVREIVMERIFDAPRELVWKLWTDPALIPRWWGPANLTTVVDRMEVKPGGVWRFLQRDGSGNEYAFHGEYREIVPPERIVATFNFEPIGPGHELVEVVTLEDHGGKTRLTSRAIYRSIEDLEGMLRSGMEEGATETMNRFAELLQARIRNGR
jgi:uncharacterized protein YndB with AHSA1/START domain